MAIFSNIVRQDFGSGGAAFTAVAYVDGKPITVHAVGENGMFKTASLNEDTIYIANHAHGAGAVGFSWNKGQAPSGLTLVGKFEGRINGLGTSQVTHSKIVFNPDVLKTHPGVTVNIIRTGTIIISGIYGQAGAPPPNRKPTAKIGQGYTVRANEMIKLDASASSDPDNDKIAQYKWTLEKQPSGSYLNGTTTAVPYYDFRPSVAGSYTIGLRVSDGKEDSDVVYTYVNVSVANRPPTVTIGGGRAISAGERVDLNNVTTADPDNDPIKSFAWTLIAPPGSSAKISDTTARNPYFVADVAGTYTARLVVNDGRSSSSPATATWTAAQPNQAPIAKLGGKAEVEVNELIEIDGGGSSDPDPGTTLEYRWSLVKQPAGSKLSVVGLTAAKISIRPDLVGEYVIELKVFDGEVESTPVQLNLSVIPANNVPTAHAGIDGTGAVGYPIPLLGKGTDADANDTLTYSWELEGPDGTTTKIVDPTLPLTSFTPDKPGTYFAKLTVSDTKAESKTAIATWTVVEATEPTEDNIGIEIGAIGDAKAEYVTLTNIGPTRIVLDGVEVRVPTAPAEATHKRLTFGATHLLEPGESVKILVAPAGDALAFGSQIALFGDTQTCTVALVRNDVVFASKTINNTPSKPDPLTGKEAFEELEIDFYRVGSTLKEYVQLLNSTKDAINLKGLTVAVPSAQKKVVEAGQHLFEFVADTIVEPQDHVLISAGPRAGFTHSFGSQLPMFYSSENGAPANYKDVVELRVGQDVIKSRTKGANDADELPSI